MTRKEFEVVARIIAKISQGKSDEERAENIRQATYILRETNERFDDLKFMRAVEKHYSEWVELIQAI